MEKRVGKSCAAAQLTGMVLVVLIVLASLAAAHQFSDWSAPANLDAPVNTAASEQAAFISKDGLSLYFASNRTGGLGGTDIWVSRRASLDEPWGEPENLGAPINSASSEFAPSLTIDGHTLFFQSTRPGGFGGFDLYASRRHNKRDDFGWQPPVNLGGEINTSANEEHPAYFEDDETGITTLYFTSNRLGADDIYASTLQPDETFGPATVVEELSSPFVDRQPAIRRDGLEMFLASDRPGTYGLLDLWVSTRASTSHPWSAPVNLGPLVNSDFIDARPALSFEGTELYFQSTRPGGFGAQDLYLSTRSKLKRQN